MTAELRLLGGAALIAPDGRPISGAAAQPRRVAVLAVLAEAWPSAVTRDRLVGLIWPDQSDAGARRLLTQALYTLRRELGGFTHAAGRDMAIDAEALRVDLIEFRRALAAGQLEEAAALYRGPALDGFHLRGALEFERWTETLRDDTRRRFQRGVEEIVARHQAAGRVREAARWSERLVQAAPFDVGGVLHALDLWQQAGDPAAALAAAAAYERRVREQLELAPDPAVQRRVAELRAEAQPAAHGTASIVDAGAVERSAPAAADGRDVPDTADAAADAPDSLALSRPRPARRRRVGAWIGASALALSALAAILMPRAAHERAAAHVVTVAPFEVRGDAHADSALGAAVTRILVTNLDGSSGLRVVGATTTQGRTVWAVLSGAVVATGGDLRIDAELRPTDAAAAAAPAGPMVVSVTGPRDRLIELTERLSLQLLPALYTARGEVPDGVKLPPFGRAASLRLYLDGEAAFRRGAFEDAYASFKSATELDSTQAYAWFRRAIAAENAHHVDDVAASIAAAQALAETLSARERLLLRGYQSRHRGDARLAEPIFRHLLEAESEDEEVWFQLAELAYHAGPLYGHPLRAARDPWHRVVAMDSGSFPALTHAIRLDAHAGDTAAVSTLLRRVEAIGATGTAAAETRIIAAYGTGDTRAIAAAQAILDSLPDYSLQFVHGVLAGQLEQLEAARTVASRMIAPSRPRAIQAEGHIALAHLALAQGRWRDAWAALDVAVRANPVAAAWTRAYFATLPFLPVPETARAEAARDLATVRLGSAAAPLYLQVAVDMSAAAVIDRYLADLLRLSAAPGGQSEPGTLDCDAAAALPASSRELCVDLRLGVAAEAARRGNNSAEALRRVEALGMRVPYSFAGRSAFFARSRERFLRAELLERAGRDAEAYDWYDAVPQGAWTDYIYLAPSHLARGRIRERQGDRAGAAVHYRKVLALWLDPDTELAPVRRAAEEGLRRVSASR